MSECTITNTAQWHSAVAQAKIEYVLWEWSTKVMPSVVQAIRQNELVDTIHVVIHIPHEMSHPAEV